jgi:hypothetical protein
MVFEGKLRFSKFQNRPASKFVSSVLLLLAVIIGLGPASGGRSEAQCCAGCSNPAGAAMPAKACRTSSEYRLPAPLQDLAKTYKVRLVYFVPSDREPTKHYRQKITTVMMILADVYRRSLQGQGYETEGLDFHFENGELVIHLMQGRAKAVYYSGWPEYKFHTTWKRVLPEVEVAYGSARKNLYIIFVESYDEAPARYEWPGGVALGARYSAEGGAGMFSSWILRDEFCATTIEDQIHYLADDIPIVGRTALGHGRKDSPRYQFIEDGFGAVLHELGHAFGLPHDKRNEREYIMGNGFRKLRHNYLPHLNQPPIGFSPANASILAYSRFLNTKADLNDNQKPIIKVEAPPSLKASDNQITLSLDFQDNGKLGGYVVFAKSQDSVIGGGKLEGSDWREKQTFPIRQLTAGENCQITVLVIDHGGNLVSHKVVVPVE